jgi:hypothetical protein
MLRRSAAAGTGAVMLLLAGCGGNSPTATPPAHRPAVSATAASPSSAVNKTMDQVLSDLHFASEGIGEDRLRPVQDKRAAAEGLPPCQAAGAIMTPKVPGRAELLFFTSRLQKRGWKLESAVQEDLTGLQSGRWHLMLGAVPIPEETKAQAGANKGAIAVQAGGVCKRLS